MSKISLEEFYTNYFPNLNSDDLILDVRRLEEFQENRLSNSINIPHDEVGNQLAKLEGKKRIFIHCKMGGRAGKAYEVLKNSLNTNVELYGITEGGMHEWISNGYPYEK